MAIIPISLPPGMYKNGTPYTRKTRWTDGNLIRWHNGSLRPIGGWTRRQQAAGAGDVPALISDPDLEAVRDIFAWRSNDQSQNLVCGSNLALYSVSSIGVVTDITYAGYAPNNSSKNASVQAGYGQNVFGVGAYGVANNLIGQTPIPPDRWYFDNFGEILITGVRGNGGIYELDLGTLTLSQVANAPSQAQDVCVTDQRQVFVIGAGGQPRRIRSSEVEDRTDWTPATANQSIDRTLPGSGRLLRCLNVLRNILILGETDAYVARYIGPPYVFSIDLAGENCGPLAAEAVARTDRFAVWWGSRNFWFYDGSIRQIDCEVIDFLYSDLAFEQVSKISTFTNTDYTEVWWLYQSTSSETGEVDSYVMWDYLANTWTTGRLNRTAGFDKGVLQQQIMIDNEGVIFNHELEDVLPSGDGAIFAETGALELGNGEANMAVQYIYPDTENGNGVSYELIARQMPNATEYTFGPYSYQAQDPIPTTGVLGREIKMRVTLTDAAAEVGNHRFDVAKMGTGRR